MNQKRIKYFLAILLSLAVQQAYSQSYTPIDGTINTYVSITDIRSADQANLDSVVVTSTTGFGVLDTVLVYCVQGADIETDINYEPGDDDQNPRNAGKYAFFLIGEIIGDTVVLNALLDPLGAPLERHIQPLVPGEVAQLIRVRSYRYANVTGAGLSAPDWDPLTGTGGVIALFAQGILRLDGDIDVSGAGFRGAPGSSDANYTSGCADPDTMQHFYLDGQVVAGLKGEGTTITTFPYTRGKASSINGGGGNGLMAGGGGGSNYSAGVRGGEQSSSCTPGDSLTGGSGGFDLGRLGFYYVNLNPFGRGDRIFFGGGGGSGTRPASAGTTDGGNGGGIVIIVADTIMGNGGGIFADGEDVTATASNGAGAGGGGGGCIILDVAGYMGSITLSAVGGDGGNSSGSDTTGMGGAGGGGFYWYAGSVNPPELVRNFTTGTNGVFESGTPYDPLDPPSLPGQEDELVAPLRGFIFNPVPSEFWICSDQDPVPIVASDAKGGDGSYSYQWIDSSKVQNEWLAIGGATSRDYDPGPLSDTTYFRRVVTSAGAVDTSFMISVYVHPAITDNTIAANDTVCSGNAPELFESAATIGGGPTGGTFNYIWQHFPDDSTDYTDLTSKTTEPTYQAGGLTTSTNYRRIAYAGVCIDTSNAERVRVLETLTGNDITPNDTICVNTAPDLISGPAPSNGDQDDIRYQWLTSTTAGDMGTLIAGETGISYQSPPLSQTTYIRRVVLSGNDDACRDTSAYVEILNVPAITNNNISASHTVCQQDQANLLGGSSPSGGYMGQYGYTWIASTDQSNWTPATGGGANDVMTDFDPGLMTGDTTWYRRVVGSGGLELVCKDTSASVVINVLPSITNNIITPAADVLCQQDIPEEISGSLPGGGATVEGNDPTRIYRWEQAQIEGIPGSGDWSHPSTGADGQDYTDPSQLSTDVDRWYKRIVISGPAGECTDTSNLVHLVVHSEIAANAIDNAQAICFDDATGPSLRHAALSGGEDTIVPVYTWRYWLEGETSADAVDIPASDEQQYTPAPYTDPGTLIYYYDRVVEIGACRDTSNAMQLIVMQLPGGQLTDADFDVCEKDTFLQLDLNMAGLTPGYYVTPWEVYLEDGVNPERIGPGLVDDLDPDTMGVVLDTYGADQVSYAYEIESIRYYPEGDAYACISPPSLLTGDPVLINVSRRPDPQILTDGPSNDSFKVCNTTATLVMDPDNGFLSYWSDPAGSVFFSPGTGENEFNVSIPNEHDEFGEYRIYARSEAGDCAGTDFIDLHFFEQPAPANAGWEDTILFLIDQVQLRADPPTAGTGVWRVDEGNGNIEDLNDPTTFVYNLDEGENTFTWTVTNGEDEGTCSTTTDVTIVRRLEVKKYNGFSPNGDMSNEYYIMQGLPYADDFTLTFINSLGSTVRTLTKEDVEQMEYDPSLITGGLREDEMVVWDGKADNGNMVASGTYYFVLEYTIYSRDYQTQEIIGETSETFKDYVVVVRE